MGPKALLPGFPRGVSDTPPLAWDGIDTPWEIGLNSWFKTNVFKNVIQIKFIKVPDLKQMSLNTWYQIYLDTWYKSNVFECPI